MASTSRPIYAAPAAAMASQPAGTFVPGTKVQVGSHRVVVEKYLSEGGFAHVYVVRLPAPDNTQAVLKRVAVPDKDSLASMRTEVDTMKKLKGHERIVSYIDSHASQLQGGGYEVFLLMEYCQGGGLIDFMNTRLKNRLTEPEILEIFQDAAEGVACMHYLKPPLLHRDLKIENILISTTPKRSYKLCDFGSSAPPRPAASNATEGRLIEDDVLKNTTLQYRSPEMVDVYRGRPIDEKSDIWALGVFLYKLCYYTTPFEEQGQMAILTASFKFPGYPQFTDRLKRLIALMLMEDPSRRPNIYQILKEVCSIRGKDMPIKDIYADRTRSEARNSQKLPPRDLDVKSPPLVGAAISAPDQQKQALPDVAPMRRGRPSAPSQSGPKPASSDPFAALDSKNYDERVKAVNELSNKFPTVDDFSLLQDKNAKFQFNSKAASGGASAPQPPSKSSQLSQRVTNALADQAFKKPSPPQADPAPLNVRPEPVRPKTSSMQTDEAPQKPPKPSMVSVGTMTSPDESDKKPLPSATKPRPTDRPIWRVPQVDAPSPRLGAIDRFDAQARSMSRSPQPDLDSISARPSMEGVGRPLSANPSGDVHRSRSANAPPSNDLLSVDQPSKRDSFFRRHSSRHSRQLDPQDASPLNEPNIESNLDYLRAAEEESSSKLSHHRSSSSHKTKASLGHLAGKFGDTFKKFDTSRSSSRQPRYDSSVIDADAEYVARASVESRGAGDDDDDRIDITEDLSPEMRRELERRQLDQEERRVEEAALAYRQRLGANGTGTGGPSRASAIQNRVKTLLDESGRTSSAKRTAEGYGRYTATAAPQDQPARTATAPMPSQRTDALPARVASTSVRSGLAQGMPSDSATSAPPIVQPDALPQRSSSIATGPPRSKPVMTGPGRPNAPPKPVALRTGGGQPLPIRGPMQPAMPAAPISHDITAPAAAPEDPDWEATFAKRYPRLSLEMVDAEGPARGAGASAGDGAAEYVDESPIGQKSTSNRPLRVRDV